MKLPSLTEQIYFHNSANDNHRSSYRYPDDFLKLKKLGFDFGPKFSGEICEIILNSSLERPSIWLWRSLMAPCLSRNLLWTWQLCLLSSVTKLYCFCALLSTATARLRSPISRSNWLSIFSATNPIDQWSLMISTYFFNVTQKWKRILYHLGLNRWWIVFSRLNSPAGEKKRCKLTFTAKSITLDD